jgi:hypothetical protein
MERQVMENSANTKSWFTKNSANTESRVTQNSANTESRVMENSANTENWVMQYSGGRKPEEGKGAAPSKKASSTVVPKRYYQDTKMQIAKDAPKRVVREKRRGRARLLV